MFYVFMAFGAVWLFVTLYLVYMGFRQRRIDDEIRMIREEIDAASQ